VTDLLLGPEGPQALSSPRIPGGPFHGTGCALSAAIAAFLAKHLPVPNAVREGRAFVQQLLHHSLALGQGARVLHPQAVQSQQRSGESHG